MSPYLLLTLSAFAAQALLFVPVVPMLLAAGALAAHAQLGAVPAVLALVAGIELGDLMWYSLGRFYGRPILNRICRAALEPDTCVRRAQDLFGRYGARGLLVAKFVPGLSTVALPLAGVFDMRPQRFVLYDSAGVLAWVAAYILIGYYTAGSLVWLRERLMPTWTVDAAIACAGLIGYFLWKYRRRQAVAREARTERITVDELALKLASREPVFVVDLRHRMDVELYPYTIPGAHYLATEDLPNRVRELRRHSEVVLVCACPDEVTSAQYALRLRAAGVRRVRPLLGGLAAWRSRDLPVVPISPVVPPESRVLNAA